jgi:hypothetical protein
MKYKKRGAEAVPLHGDEAPIPPIPYESEKRCIKEQYSFFICLMSSLLMKKYSRNVPDFVCLIPSTFNLRYPSISYAIHSNLI